MEINIKPKKITKENFAKFGDIISTENIFLQNMRTANLLQTQFNV